MKKKILATLASGTWINLSEFLRNEILFKQRWTDKYSSLGLDFPSAPINAALWIVWGFVFAACIVAICRRFSFAGSLLLSWTLGFLLMWIVVGNLGILPLGLLPIAIPWSIAELFLAVLAVRWILQQQSIEQNGHEETSTTPGAKPESNEETQSKLENRNK